jgi:hypothetical protein
MENFIFYLLKAGICTGIFLLVYQLFFCRTTFLHFNRMYLLIGLPAAFLLPAFRYTYEVRLPLASYGAETLSVPSPVSGMFPMEGWTIDGWTILFIVYLSGLFIQIFRSIKGYYSLKKLFRQGIKMTDGSQQIITHPNIKMPFTVFSRIFINVDNISETEKDLILKHEKTHVRQKHWIDLLFSECARWLQWFNPLMWLYVNLLKENHEFLADQAVLNEGVSPAIYQATLINRQVGYSLFSFSSPFKFSNPLNRIKMMKKEKTSPWKKMAIFVLIPTFGIFFWVSASPRYVFDSANLSQAMPEKGDTLYYIVADSFVIYNPQVVPKNDNSPKKLPPVFIDGKEATWEEVEKQSFSHGTYYSGDEAVKRYGEKGKNGVHELVTKKFAEENKIVPKASVDDSPQKTPLVFIDGKEATWEEVKKQSFSHGTYYSGENAVKRYGEKGKNGVHELVTKKFAEEEKIIENK